MRTIGSVICLALSLVVSSQITFEELEWNDALKKAKSEKKLIFLEAYASWSEPCQLLEKYTFSDLEVANFYNENFLNLRLDMEEYPGIGLAEEYDVSIYPTMLFIDSNGNLQHRGCGAMEAGELLALGKEALGANNWQSLRKRFDAGERESTFLLNYLALMEEGCLNAEGFAQKLLAETSKEDLASDSAFALLEEYQWDIYSREFEFLKENRELFENALGKERVNNKIFNTYLAQYQEIYASEELHLFAMRALLDNLEEVTFTGSDTLLTMANLHYSEIAEDWESFSESAIAWVGMSGLNDEEELNELAWKFYLFVDNEEKLKLASTWAREAVDKTPSPSSIDTYASLLFKLGNSKKAIELEKQAIVMAIELQEDVAHYEHQLKTFQGN
ncbi:MAG: DUF255 domain-containing protein [Cyclobacteriaceae bacterium]